MSTSPPAGPETTSLSQVLLRLCAVEARLLDGLAVALSEEDATVDQWRILRLVSHLGGPTMGDLAAASGLANASLSRVVDALEDAASVFRLPDGQDRRRITVQLSDHGAARLSRMDGLVTAWEQAHVARVGAGTIDALARAVHRTSEYLGLDDQQR